MYDFVWHCNRITRLPDYCVFDCIYYIDSQVPDSHVFPFPRRRGEQAGEHVLRNKLPHDGWHKEERILALTPFGSTRSATTVREPGRMSWFHKVATRINQTQHTPRSMSEPTPHGHHKLGPINLAHGSFAALMSRQMANNRIDMAVTTTLSSIKFLHAGGTTGNHGVVLLLSQAWAGSSCHGRHSCLPAGCATLFLVVAYTPNEQSDVQLKDAV